MSDKYYNIHVDGDVGIIGDWGSFINGENNGEIKREINLTISDPVAIKELLTAVNKIHPTNNLEAAKVNIIINELKSGHASTSKIDAAIQWLHRKCNPEILSKVLSFIKILGKFTGV